MRKKISKLKNKESLCKDQMQKLFKGKLQVNIFQKVPLVSHFIKESERVFYMAVCYMALNALYASTYCCAEKSVKFFDKMMKKKVLSVLHFEFDFLTFNKPNLSVRWQLGEGEEIQT